MIWSFVQVAIGGALGASMRYASILGVVGLFGVRFPIGTLLVNILGSLLLGFLVVLIDQRNWASLAPFLIMGILGGFTTFSAFSLDAYNPFARGDLIACLAYIVFSVSFSISALVTGIIIGRYIIL